MFISGAVIPPWLRFLNSNPAAERFEPRVQWRLGDLAPRETRLLELNCRAVREGDVRLPVRAQSEGGLTAEGFTNLRIIMPALEARFVDPPTTARVGDRVTFNVEVTNTGTGRLTNVIARDRFDLHTREHRPRLFDRPLLNTDPDLHLGLERPRPSEAFAFKTDLESVRPVRRVRQVCYPQLRRQRVEQAL